ncbi:ABC transporter permease subunit, partial [Loigolactobacillus coryniformis]
MNNFIQAYSWLNIRYLLEGLWITVEISAISIVLSFIIGGLLGLLRYVKIKYLSALVGFVIDIIRNLPLLLILFFTFFGLPNIGIKPDVVMAAILAMTVFESAMVAEIIRSGI